MGRIAFTDLPEELRLNLDRLIGAVNGLLLDLKAEGLLKSVNVIVSSGYRSLALNSGIGGAKRSYHMRCLAVDLQDKDGNLAKIIASRPDLLKKHKLWLESPAHTKGWIHLDLGERTDRQSRVFLP